MAFGSLLALLDDIATVLDDVSAMSQVAAKKTAGVLGDDLAVNAEKVIGVRPERELPVVWAVAKGSFLNKVILVPAALLIATFTPWLITPLMLCGGVFLCFEGAEKLLHRGEGKHSPEQAAETLKKLADSNLNLAQLELEKIKGAIRTDFILSAEIIVLTLGVVEGSELLSQIVVLSGIATLMTIFVYGLVAGIVKIDDLGVLLMERDGESAFTGLLRKTGAGLLWLAPRLMTTLTVVGTAAMFFVGGGIFLHAAHGVEAWLQATLEAVPLAGLLIASLSAVFGVVLGIVLVKTLGWLASFRAVK